MLTTLRTTVTATVLAAASWWVWTGFATERVALLHPAGHDLATLLLGVAAVLLQLVLLRAAGELVVLVVARLRQRPTPTASGVRRAVGLLTGLTVSVALSAPALADGRAHRPAPPSGLSGLALPDRALGTAPTEPARMTGPARPSRPARTAAVRVVPVRGHVVRPGESLWSISATTLPRASPERLAAYVVRLYDANRAVIGDDPDLIRPGSRLLLPHPHPIQEDR